MADQDGAIEMYVPLSITFDTVTPRWIVIHKTAGFSTAQDCAIYFQTAGSVSSHYIIGRDGTIVQCVSEDRGAGANCCLTTGHADFLPSGVNLNLYTISIEHIDPATDNSTPCTDAQIAASIRLIRGIAERNNIPLRAGDATGGIIRHADIDPINRARCPGNYPLDYVLSSLQQEAGEEIAMLEIGKGMGSYFTDKGGGRWHCTKTNVDVIGENLDFYKAHGGIFGLPLTNEIYLQQWPGTALVIYERAYVLYDPKRTIDNPPVEGNCYLLHLDGGYAQQAIAAPLLKSLQDQITDLNKQVSALKSQTSDALQKQVDAYKQAVSLVLSTLQPLK